MTGLVLELNDAGLTWSADSGILATESGYAVLSDSGVITGARAVAQAHLEPRLCRNRYWDELSANIGADDKSHAELAFLQLQRMFTDLGSPTKDVLLVTPGHYSREQLGLVLGIGKECGINITALIESAVAAASRPSPGRQLIHLDVGLHRVSVSVMGQDDTAHVEREEHLVDTGIVASMDRWARRVSELFVIATRFDPLHQAETEQRLYDALPNWIEQLQRDDKLLVELDGHELSLERSQFVSALDDQFRALVQLITSLRSPAVTATLQVSHRLAQMPGLCASLGRLEDSEVVVLPPSHAASAVHAAAEHLGGGDKAGLRLIRRLPWRGEPWTTIASASQPAVIKKQALPATHVVYAGLAHSATAGLVIGRSPAPDRAHLVLVGNTEAVSAEHCEVQFRDGELWLRDLSRYGTLVNQQRVAGETRLRPGDEIQIGSQTMMMIGMAEANGS